MPAELRGLYAITPDLADGERLLAMVDAVLAGGCRLLQYRDKTSAMPERLARAHALRDLTRRHGARLIINDDLALCLRVGADGLHAGREDGHLGTLRAILGPDRLLGASCYADLARAEAAARAGADYLAFGAAYPSTVKPDAPHAAVDLFRTARSRFTQPICAIGGITLDNAPPLIEAGVDLLAVITDLFSAPDIAGRARTYAPLFHPPETAGLML